MNQDEPDREPVPRDTAARAELSRRLEALLTPLPAGRLCPFCGGIMAHYRLGGYRCLRGCTP